MAIVLAATKYIHYLIVTIETTTEDIEVRWCTGRGLTYDIAATELLELMFTKCCKFRHSQMNLH